MLGSHAALLADDPLDHDLRIASDFDAVLADDSSERLYVEEGIEQYGANEVQMEEIPLPPGPLKDLLEAINRIQDLEDQRSRSDSDYRRRLFVSLVTARNAPAHARAIKTLKSWGLRVNDGFFLGGWEKGAVLQVAQRTPGPPPCMSERPGSPPAQQPTEDARARPRPTTPRITQGSRHTV